MKQKKFKICFLIVFCMATLTTGLFASPKVGSVIGKIYSTDIVAYINGFPIPSYNIGGKTAIIVEDLKNYGFDVTWENAERRLVPIYNPHKKFTANYIPSKKKPGKVIGKVYYTDINAFYNRKIALPCYNIGGRMAITLEDLATYNWRDGYGRTYPEFPNNDVRLTWNPTARTIRLDLLSPGTKLNTTLGPQTVSDVYNDFFSLNYSAPIYLNDVNIIGCSNIENGHGVYFSLTYMLDSLGCPYKMDTSTNTLYIENKFSPMNKPGYGGGTIIYSNQQLAATTSLHIAVDGVPATLAKDALFILPGTLRGSTSEVYIKVNSFAELLHLKGDFTNALWEVHFKS